MIIIMLTVVVFKSWGQYNPGKLAVLVIGDGSTALSSNAAPLFIREFNTSGTGQSGTLRTTFPVTTVGGISSVDRALTQSGSATSEGFLNLSVNRQVLTLVGYNVTSGTASVNNTLSTTFPTNTRVVGKVGTNGTPDTKTTLFTSYSANNVRSAITSDGSGYWIGGPSTGLTYVPDGNVAASIVLGSTNSRGMGIFNNQLYASSGSGSIRLATVGTGLPTSGTPTVTNLSGFLTSTGDPYSFVFIDINSNSTPDVVYVASLNTAPSGLLKYTSSDEGTTWTARGSLTGNIFGVTGVYNSCSQNVELYITSNTSNAKPNSLYKFTDLSVTVASPANITSSGSALSAVGTLLASAAVNTAFGGVAFTPTTTLLAPAAFTVTGTGSYCSGGTGVAVGLANSETGVSYQLYRNGGVTAVGSPVTGTGNAISFGNQTIGDTYSVVATNSLTGCTTNMTGSAVVTVDPLPTVNAGAANTICTGSAYTLTGASIGGAATTGTWSITGITGTMTNASSQLSNTAATATPAAISFTPIAGNSGTVTLTLTTDDPAGPCGAVSSSVTLTVNGYTWNGGTNGDFANTANWTSCGVPPGGANFTIATTGTNPSLQANTSVGNIIFNSGTSLNINGFTLTVNGNISGSGTLTGSPTANLVIGGAAGTLNFTQTNANTRSINNITFNTGATATLGDVLDVYGDIEFTPSTSNSFNVNGKNLTLKSTNTYTARIGNLTGTTLSDATNVTVERFFNLRTTGGVGTGNTGRAYRLVASTVNTTGHPTKPTIKDNWMEAAMNTGIGVPNNIDPKPGYGVQITGTGGNSNGFDVTQSNASSLYNASNAVTPSYTAVGNTSGALNPLTGYFLYVRGDRSMDMTIPLAAGTMPTSSTTLRATGAIQMNDQSAFGTFNNTAGALNLVTNPYPSPIYWPSLYNDGATANIVDAYTYWDPNLGNRGGFATVNIAGGTSTAESGTPGGNRYIQSGQAFFVQATGGGNVGLTIKETHKAQGENNTVFIVPPPPIESFRISLFYTETNGYRQLADGALAIFGDYQAAVDNHDAFEINNWDENIAISRDGKRLAIESRPVIVKSDELPLFMNNMKQRAYEFQFEPVEFTNKNLKAELIDNYLNTRTLLSVTAPTVVSFIITADAASKATDRFKVVFGQFGNPQGVDVVTIKAAQKNNGIQVNWNAKTETDMVRYEVERQIYGTGFVKVNSTAAKGNSLEAVDYSWLDTDPVTGTSYYRIKGTDKAGNKLYTDVVRVLFGKGEPEIVVYPNPVTGRQFKLDMYNLVKGTYILNLYSIDGRLVYTEQIQHDGSQATRTITTDPEMPKGAYQLQMAGGKGFSTTQRVIFN